MIASFLKNIAETTMRGDAREESYYGVFAEFLREFGQANGSPQTQVTTLPKKTEAGNPDFRIWDGTQNITGYIEAKKPGENLDIIENTSQLKRYRGTFPNLILTDFYEYRLYRDGQLMEKTAIGRPFIAQKLKTLPPVENEEAFRSLLARFFAFSIPKVYSAEALATELAKRTRFLRDEVIVEELEQEESGQGKLFGFYLAFKQYLVGNLAQKDFADIYSQTIAYGLFAARTRANGNFNRKMAYDLIPQTIGILRDIFQFVSLGNVPLQMQVIIDDIAEVLQVADVNKILDEYYRKGKGEDPIVHFYETFLNLYDPATREKRGVYYTPEPVVKYIVRSVHQLLKTHFKIPDGLAGNEVTLLDPAGGTLTFPAEAIKLAVQEHGEKYGDGGRHSLIKNHILKNYYAFELMMAPYAIGHLKISFLLEELGYTMSDDERFKLYLTNTLDMEVLPETQLPGLGSLSAESHLAGRVKQVEPILAIMGNPPYSGHSANNNAWTEKLMKQSLDGAQNYYELDGKPLGEKNPKWLQDDYVKFMRFAQWKIHKAGRGIVGMITNHSYLDNPTFRGMRQSLMNTFNEIHIIDLHGNALKKETSPEGGKDDNVFDIRQGTAIAIMVKTKNGKGCKVYHKDMYGKRENKYGWLSENEFKLKDYAELKPVSPWYFLTKTNTIDIEHYNKWWKVNDVFPVSSVGIATARDNLTIQWSRSEVLSTIRLFSKLNVEVARQTFGLGSDTRDWKVKLAQEDLKKTNTASENVFPVLYRPFDHRFTYYTGNSRGFHCMPRNEVMQHLLKDNIGLTIGRQGQVVGSEHPWNLAFVTDSIIDLNLFYRGGELLFPLYIYPAAAPKKKSIQAMILFEPEVEYGGIKRRPNISAKLYEQLTSAYKQKPEPEQILGYVYAVLYSNAYRQKYAEFLKIDFPRIPFAKNRGLFLKMAQMGSELVAIHLLHEYAFNKYDVKYSGSGEDKIEKPSYRPGEQRVYINETRYFEGIRPEIWDYPIGGYQVMEKYLKDRKGRQMDDPAHYCRMAAALAKTIELQGEIDAVFGEVEGEVIEG